MYRKEHFVVIGNTEHGLLLGEIELIIISQENKVNFLVKEHEAFLWENLHVCKIPVLPVSVTNVYKCVEFSMLRDYYPLCAYKEGKYFMIPLKHAVSLI